MFFWMCFYVLMFLKLFYNFSLIIGAIIFVLYYYSVSFKVFFYSCSLFYVIAQLRAPLYSNS